MCIWCILAVSACATCEISAQVPADYQQRYETLVGKSGATLFSALESISAVGYDNVGYDGLYEAYKKTDMDANGYLLDMYSTCLFTLSDKCGSYSNVCDCFNREHSLPKSWWGSGKNSCYSDLFHLVPTDGKVNNQRGNLPFGECANGGTLPGGHALGKKGPSTFSGHTNVGTVFEPDDMYKGDFARGYFGMIVHFGNSVDFTKSEGATMFSNSSRNISAQNHYGLTAYSVALLMKWTRQDPVSTKETNRNNGIQQTQGNRNPFIDCPVLAEYLWGDKAGQPVDHADLEACGCVDSSYTALEDIYAEPTDYVSRLASVSLTPVWGGFTLSCLPSNVQILLFDATGSLLQREQTNLPEMTVNMPTGFYLVVLAVPGETRPFKVQIQ